ncbi:MAG: hypothetical protein CL490_12425, partial [Acinetobacter sp.]|nr:hypothetical protein [Acinetobacter sp.]
MLKNHSNEIKKGVRGLRVYGYGVECTSIGGDADKNLLRNKDLARLVRFLDWLISFKNIEIT